MTADPFDPPPPLSVHVLWDPDAAPERLALARALAERLFVFLDHDPHDADHQQVPTLETGVGVPVFVGHHSAAVQRLLAQPEARVVIVLLGDSDFDGAALRATGDGRALVLSYALDDPPPDRGALELEVAIRLSAFLEPQPGPVALVVPQIEGAPDLAAQLPPCALFAVHRTRPGSSLLDLPEARAGRALCLVLHTPGFAADPWAHGEILAAKQLHLPIVEVVVATGEETRAFPYFGNVQIVRSLGGAIEACVRAWLRHRRFHHQAPALIARRKVEGASVEPLVLTRPPELLDLVQGPLPLARSVVALYPDPPLSAAEAALLRRTNRRARLVTPTTFTESTLSLDPSPPLIGWGVALSLSHSPELAGSFSAVTKDLAGTTGEGTVLAHLNAAIVYLSLSLLRLGAKLAYGGHLDRDGYTRLLERLVYATARARREPEDALLHFAASQLWPTQAASDPFRAARVWIPVEGPGATDDVGRAVELAQVRRAMAESDQVHARVIMGGKTHPDGVVRQGYVGRLPGQAEEAYQHLRLGKPLFVVGGFRGAAGQVARALLGQMDDLPREEALRSASDDYAAFCTEFGDAPDHAQEQPATVDELWEGLRAQAAAFWHEEDGTCPNGLTCEENRRLFRTVQHDEITTLVLRGLLRLGQKRAHDPARPLKVALFNGSTAEAMDVDGYAVLAIGRRPLSAADHALDTLLDGAVRTRLASGAPTRILHVDDERLSGTWVIPAAVTPKDSAPADRVSAAAWVEEQIDHALKLVCERATTYRIGSIALALFGVGLGLPVRDAVAAQIRALRTHRGNKGLHSVVLCEEDPIVFAALRDALERLEKQTDAPIVLTVLPERVARRDGHQATLLLHFRAVGAHAIEQYARAPSPRGAVAVHQRAFDWDGFHAAFDGRRGAPPAFAELEEAGLALYESFTTEDVRRAIAENEKRPWDIVHDDACAEIPFEALAVPGADGALWRPALTTGIRRGLLLNGMAPGAAFAPAPTVSMLLVANPTGDLKNTVKEADALLELARTLGGALKIRALVGAEATREAVLAELATGRYDLVHYAGHGVSDPQRPELSGLLFRKGTLRPRRREDVLTAEDLAALDPASAPSFVFLNCCYGADVRRTEPLRPATVAQGVLQWGARAFVGNRWKVSDGAAAAFSVAMYRAWIKERVPLREAVRGAREALHNAQIRDWANFQVYGADDLVLWGR